VNDSLPWYVTVVFVLTTLLTIGFLFHSFRDLRTSRLARGLITFAIPFWLILTAFLAIGGFYSHFEYLPPRVAVFGVLPALLFIAAFFAFFRPFIKRLSLRTLTLVHVVRMPVEVVLFWLFQSGLVPRVMTFEGRNLDILSGISAPLIYFVTFRRTGQNNTLLLAWNALAVISLINIVVTAITSFPSPIQRIGVDQANVGLSEFPFIWLPTIIVPTVLFAHVAVLWRLLISKE
jgi:hypothetical protein